MKERFCWSDEAESGPKSIEAMRPAARASTATVMTADSPFTVPMRERARVAARRPISSGFSSAAQWRATVAAYSSGLRPSGSCTVASAENQKSVERRVPSKPSEWTTAPSDCVSPVPPVAEMIRFCGSAARAPASIASAQARRCSAVTPS